MSLDITGNFLLRNNRLEPAHNAARHMLYDSAFSGTVDGQTFATLIRYYVQHPATVPQGCVAFISGRLNIPLGQRTAIQASTVCVYPGDPEDSDYEASLPPLDNPIVFGVGRVITPLTQVGPGEDQLYEFAISVNQYFQSQMRESIVKSVVRMCVRSIVY